MLLFNNNLLKWIYAKSSENHRKNYIINCYYSNLTKIGIENKL